MVDEHLERIAAGLISKMMGFYFASSALPDCQLKIGWEQIVFNISRKDTCNNKVRYYKQRDGENAKLSYPLTQDEMNSATAKINAMKRRLFFESHVLSAKTLTTRISVVRYRAFRVAGTKNNSLEIKMTKDDSNISEYKLTAWQKKQAAMLYYFSSLEYLKELHGMVTALINGDVDPLIDLAKAQNRDVLMKKQKWGIRDTAANWENQAWPILKDLQASLARDIALRPAGRYSFTAVNDRLRALSEYSLQWMSHEEEDRFEVALAAISHHDLPISKTMSEFHNRWSDADFAIYYQEYFSQQSVIPKFKVRMDIRASSGDTTPQTGVYVALDDPNAALQFAWTQKNGIKLRMANTFNHIGLSALQSVGRSDLWFDSKKMFAFADQPGYAKIFRDWIYVDGHPIPDAAAGAVAMSAFETRKCEWAFVEIVPGEIESIVLLDSSINAKSECAERVVGGAICKIPGFYFTPSSPNSRQFFHAGDLMPNIGSENWTTYWQRDQNQ